MVADCGGGTSCLEASGFIAGLLDGVEGVNTGGSDD